MSARLTKRERVERTMAFQETDRIPLYDLLYNDAIFAHFHGAPLPPLVKDDATVAELNRIAGQAVGAFLDMTRSVNFGPIIEEDLTDQYGLVWHRAPFEKTSWVARRPFDDEPGAKKFLKQWIAHHDAQRRDIEHDPGTFRDQYHRSFRQTQLLIGDTVNLFAQHGTGLDDISARLGLELFAYVAVDDPGLIAEAMESFTRYNLTVCRTVADRTLSPVVLTYGDIAHKDRLLYAPDFLRREFFPRLKRLNDAWHEYGFKCLFHSDGYLMDVMDDLIAAGIDGLNPIEIVAGMNLKELRDKYGHRLFLAGGIDMSQLLSRGTPDQVRAVCRDAIRDTAPGYFMGSTTESDNSCRLENLLAMREVAFTKGH